ncbi:hypothetical protein CDCA_CDCA06G1949 [Cyanidium caldarium]|uniref:Enoyl reductase (ER) domain-containing protein n=1 Tax=Cyanidium caldarium TaxID=2771 RepID=A0AAV9IUU9_CYACA|nr:hypothetical protein CDCA_CDCA06G1949 [Cyanidium caldarium]
MHRAWRWLRTMSTMRAVVPTEEFHAAKRPPPLTIGEVPRPTALQEGQLLLRVASTSVNRADLAQRRGRYPPPPGASDILGLEAFGQVAESRADGFRVGDEVVALMPGGGYGEYAVVDAGTAFSLNDFAGHYYTFDTQQGSWTKCGPDRRVACAGIAEAFLTAYQMLRFDARLAAAQRGETVLIHAGAGGVGLAAVQLARDMGLRVLVTAGTDAKVRACMQLGAERGWVYRDRPVDELVAWCGGADSVDIVLDCVGASYAAVHPQLLRRHGRWVVFGLLGGNRADIDLGQVLRKNLRISGTTLRSRELPYRTELVQQFAEYAVPKLVDGTLVPTVDAHGIFPLHDAEGAHAYVEQSSNIGKVVLLADFTTGK